MGLFSKKNKVDKSVKAFLVGLLNNNCSDLKSLIEGDRNDQRVNLSVVIGLIPIENDEPNADHAYTVVTRDFSTTGVSIILEKPIGFDLAVLAFRFDGMMKYFKAEARHLNPMGGGFYSLGFQLLEETYSGDYPQLETIHF